MSTRPAPRLSRMSQLYVLLLISTLVFACGIPMLAMHLLGLQTYEYVLFLCISTCSVLIANLLIFLLIRNRARGILNGFIEKTNRYVDLPDEYQNAKPSMEVDTIERVFTKVLGELHESIQERLRTEREGMLASIASLIMALESRDRYTQNHSARVAALSGKVARQMGMPKREVDDVRLAALLHDLGKIGIRDAVLLKTDRLTEDEYRIVKAHPSIAAQILRPIKGLGRVIELIVHHHERPDGKGYPGGPLGAQAPLGAFIIAVADTYDAMTIDRAYRPALPPDKVISELIVASGTQLHAECVDALVEVMLREKRLGLPIALTSSAWSHVEHEAARAFGHVFDNETETGSPKTARIDELIQLGQFLRKASPARREQDEQPQPATVNQ